MYYTNVDDLQNRVASRAEILVLAGNVFPDWLLIEWIGNFDDEFSMSINFWKGILIIWFHTRTTEGSLHLYNIGFSKISMPETHFPNQEDETNFKTRLRRGSRCVFLGQRFGGGEGHILGGWQDDVSGAWEQQQAGGLGGPVEVQPVKVGDFSMQNDTKKNSVHVLSAMEISLGWSPPIRECQSKVKVTYITYIYIYKY